MSSPPSRSDNHHVVIPNMNSSPMNSPVVIPHEYNHHPNQRGGGGGVGVVSPRRNGGVGSPISVNRHLHQQHQSPILTGMQHPRSFGHIPTPLTPTGGHGHGHPMVVGAGGVHPGLELPFVGGGAVVSSSAVTEIQPPPIDAKRRAMEAAVQKERTRNKELEKQEVDLSADELRKILKRERTRMSRMAADLAAMKSAAVQSVAEAEVHEEGRINCLMRRLECLQQEKGRIIVELEREEEMLTNNLQKKLEQVRKEKAVLERQVEREQLSHSKLKTKLTGIRTLQDESMAEILEEGEEEGHEEEEEDHEQEQDVAHHHQHDDDHQMQHLHQLHQPMEEEG